MNQSGRIVVRLSSCNRLNPSFLCPRNFISFGTFMLLLYLLSNLLKALITYQDLLDTLMSRLLNDFSYLTFDLKDYEEFHTNLELNKNYHVDIFSWL